jgi:hypothetical protein
VKAVLLYGCENWKNSKSITAKLQVFINKRLRKILRIFWPDQIINNDLWKQMKQSRIDLQISKRKWGWLGHTLQKPSRRHSQRSPIVESPKQMGQRETEEHMAKNSA